MRLALATFLLWSLSTQPAFAHPLVEQAAGEVERAEFERALATLARASEGEELTRQDVIELLRTRAIARFALGRDGAMRRDLVQLAAVAPAMALPESVPPAVREAFDAARQARSSPPAMAARADTGRHGFVISAELTDAPPDLVREVRVSWRFADGSWSSEPGPQVRVPAPAGSTIEYFAEAVGPGGAVLWREGDVSSPRRASTAALLGAVGAGAGAGAGAGSAQQEAPVWPWLALGAGVALAAGAVVAILLLTADRGDDRTRFDPVQVGWP